MHKINWSKIISTIIMVLAYGAGVLFVSVKLLEIANKGYFAWWQSLGKPPEDVSEILDIDPHWVDRGVDVYVKTNTNNIYVYQYDQKGWELDNSYEVINQWGCYELSERIEKYPYFSNLRGRVVDCQTIPWQFEWVSENTYIVLLDDNSLWQWHEKSLNDVYVFLCGGPVVGLIIGLIIVRTSLYRRKSPP